MYKTKSYIYSEFDKTQKSGLCNYIRALVKQNLEFSSEELFYKFVEEEKYYQELKVSRFPFLYDYLNDEKFVKETKLYINECKKYYEYKESQRPFIEKQKEFDKEKRKFLQEIKMSKEPPTKKQLYYYDKLCKRYELEKKDVQNLSKLDLKNEIERILNEHKEPYSNID